MDPLWGSHLYQSAIATIRLPDRHSRFQRFIPAATLALLLNWLEVD